MKKYFKITLGAAAIAFVSIITISKRKADTHKKTIAIANEGYETAVDMLHLNNGKPVKKMHFGPVLPHHTF
jgi:hypothetical protein